MLDGSGSLHAEARKTEDIPNFFCVLFDSPKFPDLLPKKSRSPKINHQVVRSLNETRHRIVSETKSVGPDDPLELMVDCFNLLGSCV